MQFRKLVMVASVVALPLGLIAVAAGPVSAAVKGKGTVTCAVGGEFTFTPGLTPGGTVSRGHETIGVDLTASSCTGPITNSPVITPTSATVSTKSIKVKGDKVGKTKVVGSCFTETFNPVLKLKSKLAWVQGGVRNTKAVTVALMGDGMGGLIGTAKSSGSYKGTGASITLNVATASLTAIQSVCDDGDPGIISELDFDSTASSITVG